ncbi:hypothetical protein GE061_019276 [Apolygus lucorum]|uniref:Uncharacterized protein n=1 Tax=Apolygus lucorum TaxID=248454 RepID=A0A6A4JNE3_APOLU|nr:hypothetical protein GE061_019276 [Apolygus lucorum]
MREVKIRVRVIHPKSLKRLHLKVIVRTKKGAGETVEKDFEIDLTHGTPVPDPKSREKSKTRQISQSDQDKTDGSASTENEDQNDD